MDFNQNPVFDLLIIGYEQKINGGEFHSRANVL